MKLNNPPLFIISAPSGAGKTTIFRQAQQHLSNLILSISYTTREARENEREGIDYFFIEEKTFLQKIEENEFLEWAKVHNNYYGTSRNSIKEAWESGQIVVLDIDVQGAMQLKKITDLDAVFIFIKPPSMVDLEERLINRGTESENTLQTRLKNAEWELSFQDRYDYVIINDKLNKAVDDFVGIIQEKITYTHNQ